MPVHFCKNECRPVILCNPFLLLSLHPFLSGNMRFTNKQILQITFPVLMSLLMEHMIGLTDTAYLGRVGEVELGASALAGVYYLVIYMLGFGFSIGVAVHGFASVFAFLPSQTDRFRWCLPSYDEVCGLACLWLFLLLCGRYVQGFLCRYYKDKDPDHKLGRDGVDQCNAELCPDIRKVRITGIGNCRSRDRFIGLGGCFGIVLHSLSGL